MTNAATERPAYVQRQQEKMLAERVAEKADRALSEEWGKDAYWAGYNAVETYRVIRNNTLCVDTRVLRECPFPKGTTKEALWYKGIKHAEWELDRYCTR